MAGGRRVTLLTGGTGFVGRHLLGELLRDGPVAVLARGGRGADAGDRVRELVDTAAHATGTPLPPPTVLRGDLREPGLGLSAADRSWLARSCRRVVHAAACVSFRAAPGGEPWATNAEGTRRLLALAAGAGVGEFHHVSTAFVCGAAAGPALEDAAGGPAFRNDYERSKAEAERLVRAAPGLRATVYRPSVVVGDSRTGRTTSYHGLYRFLELADRLARPDPADPSARRLAIRLPFAGGELRDLVPVDWVAAAVARIAGRPGLHGRTYHLTAAAPVAVRDVVAAAARSLGVSGLELGHPGPLADPTELETAFRDGVRDYGSYLGGDPAFDRRNSLAALPDLPCPRLDAPALDRLVRAAAAAGWGRRRREAPAAEFDCGDYIERYFPAAVGGSFLAQVPVDATLGFDIRGPGGGRWVCRFGGGRVLGVRRGTLAAAEATYRMDAATFAAVVAGRQTPQAAFFARRIEIDGCVETGLRLAVLFGRFVGGSPYHGPDAEARDAVAV